jgi:hypothetical protein
MGRVNRLNLVLLSVKSFPVQGLLLSLSPRRNVHPHMVWLHDYVGAPANTFPLFFALPARLGVRITYLLFEAAYVRR